MPRTRRTTTVPLHAPCAAVWACALTATFAVAQDDADRAEAEARAAILRAMVVLKIVPYLVHEPPSTPRKEYRIGVVGNDATVAAMLKELPGKKVGELSVVVVQVEPADAGKESSAHGCDLLWLARSVDAATRTRVLAVHAERPVPVVADQPGFAAAGGSVQLFVQDNGIKFEINAEALKQKGMRASPQLLKLSRKGPTQ